MATGAFQLGAQQAENDVAQKRQRSEQLADEQRQSKLAMLQSAWTQTTDPTQRQAIINEMGTLYPPQQHHTLLQDIQKIRSKLPGGKPAPAQVAQAPTADAAWLQIQSPRQATIADEEAKAKSALELQELKNKGSLATTQARGQNMRPVHIGDTTPQDAVANMGNLGYEYTDESGQPITKEQLEEAPPYTKLVEFRQGANTFYKLVDQNAQSLNVGGIIYQKPQIGAMGPEVLTPLGQATSTLPKTHEVPGMTPGEKIPLTTTTPSTPGAFGAGPVTTKVPKVPGAEPTLHTRPSVPVSQAAPTASSVQALTQKFPGSKKATKAPEGGVGTPPPAFAPGTMLSQGRNAEPVVAAMNTVAAQVFGGNGEKPIWENAQMFDNPGLRTALNRALTLNALAIPGTEADPTLMQTLATAVGLTGASQEAVRQANEDARTQVQELGGDAALDMLSRMAGLQEDLSALRAATKGSAAQGSIQTLVRAAPVYNVSSAQDFRNRLGVTLNTAAASMSGYPVINPQYIDWWKRGAQTARGGPTSSATPQGPTGKPNDSAVDKFLKNYQTTNARP